MGDAKSQTIYFMIGIQFHPTLFSRSYAQVVVILMVCARDDLFPYDQDHYGGLAATDELARGAQIGTRSQVADFCAGHVRQLLWPVTNQQRIEQGFALPNGSSHRIWGGC